MTGFAPHLKISRPVLCVGWKLNDANFRFTAKLSEFPSRSDGVGESAVKDGQPFDAPATDQQIARLRINTVDDEGFERRVETTSPDGAGKPARRFRVHLRASAVPPSPIIFANDTRDALRQIRRLRSNRDGRVQRRRDRARLSYEFPPSRGFASSDANLQLHAVDHPFARGLAARQYDIAVKGWLRPVASKAQGACGRLRLRGR